MTSKKIAIGFGAAAIGLALAMPATAQQDDPPSMRSRITAVSGTDWQNFYSSTTDASASAGAGMRSSTMGTAADRNPSTEPMVRHHGANPANLLCDSQQGQAQENCLASFSAGGGLQQASDGD